ncbi:MAG: hypothetical protein BRC26_04175 [Nanohaloarchaea archaeon QH_8_44_6]|nr:MAG: hypothetical protein BRC26_04175 [Nanohaloarchaea archaeon QH_8_44_6]
MKAEIIPTEKIHQLKENLKKRVERAEINGEKIEVEVEDEEKLRRIPGIDTFRVAEEKFEGLKGRPVDQQAYTRLESREDAVRALLATIQGWDLVVLETDRKWDLKQLRKYNPNIKKLKAEKPREELGIKKTVSNIEGLEKVEIEMPDEDEKETIYRKMLT